MESGQSSWIASSPPLLHFHLLTGLISCLHGRSVRRIYMTGEFTWLVDSGFKRYRCRLQTGFRQAAFRLGVNKSLIQTSKNPGCEAQMFVNLERSPKRSGGEILSIFPVRLPESSWMMRQRSANYIAAQKLASLSRPLFLVRLSLPPPLCRTFSNEHPSSSVKGTSSSQCDTISAVMESYPGQESVVLWQVFVSFCVENMSREVVVTICTGG